MNIEKITLRNFRNVGAETMFQLDPHFTAVIGINGKGKSTFLHALRIAAGTYLLGIPEAAKRHIWESEICRKDVNNSLVLQTPTIVKAEGSVDGTTLSKPWQRQIPAGKVKTTSNAEDVGEIRNIAKRKYDRVTQGDAMIDNPVIAFFGTGRLYGSGRNTIGPYLGRQIFKYGYANWFDMQYGTYQYANWLKSHSFLVADNKESAETLNAFYNALMNANPYITAIAFDGSELRLKVKMDEDLAESPYLPLSLHSDGIITHTAMVAELAFRCIMLNAHHQSDSIKKSRGIVMIDELDLHLHPTWQRHVVDDLKKAFPCIQFVATTHSPFIVQSLSSNELINLDRDTDINLKELSIDEVSEEVMGIPNRSVENETDETHSIQYLQNLSELTPENKALIVDQLNELEVKISDPAVRAFLKMKRLEKNI